MVHSKEILQLLASKVTDELVITTPGRIASEWHNIKDREGNLYQIYMSGATGYALGLALALPHRRVISLDGDGSALMGLTVLPTIANKNPSNLVIIVFDNQLYEMSSGDRIPTFTAGSADLAKIAQGSGIVDSKLIRELPEFKEAIDDAFHSNGTSFIVAKVQRPPVGTPAASLPPYDLLENKYRFIHYIEKTENIEILKRPKRVVK